MTRHTRLYMMADLVLTSRVKREEELFSFCFVNGEVAKGEQNNRAEGEAAMGFNFPRRYSSSQFEHDIA